jgi:hypothetical protein
MPATYTRTELLDHPERVLADITLSGKPAAITHLGRFQFLISPLDDHEVITAVLTHGPIADEIARRAREDSDG